MAQRFTEQTFQEWVSRPLTKVFLAYLLDQRDRLKDQWAQGQEMDPRHQTKALLLGELASLEWADVAAFYGTPDDETESAA